MMMLDVIKRIHFVVDFDSMAMVFGRLGARKIDCERSGLSILSY